MGSNWIIQRARENKGISVVVGQHVRDIRTVLFDVGPSSIMKQCPDDFMPEMNITSNMLKFPNGHIVLGLSGDQPQSARGINANSILLDEPGKYYDLQETFTQLDLGLRGESAKMMIIGTPTGHPTLKHLYKKAVDEKDPLYRFITGSTYENEANLDKNFIRALKESYGNGLIATQEIHGRIIWEVDNALFTADDIEKYRIKEKDLPDLQRIVVAVDPAVSNKKGSDSTGIIVAGVDEFDHVYVLKDATMKGSPQQWAMKVGELFDYYSADLVVAEKNNGGDMVSTTLQLYNKNLPIKLVSATRGKLLRAEPISLHFSNGKIHLVGDFPDLEKQMVEYDGKGKSPDNLDAFVWACTELTLNKKSVVRSKEFYL